MILSWTGCRFQLTPRGSQEREIAKAAGFHLDWSTKIWWSGLVECARVFENYADDSAKRKFAHQGQLIAQSQALDANIDFKAPEGLAYMGFQKAGIAFGLARPRTLNADDMGLGKTIQAAGIINNDPQATSILIIPPASLLINWERELLKWLTKKLSGDYASSTKLPNSNIVLANYDIIWKLRDKILARHWHIHVYDEAHYLKNGDAKRTMAVYGHDEKRIRSLEADRKLALTGTPVINRPVELWPMLHNFDPEGIGASFWPFAKKFCGCADQPSGMRDFSGSSNLDILQERLRSSIMIRRLKRDVLRELPAKRRQILPIPVPPNAAGVVQAELNFFDQYEQEMLAAITRAEEAQSVGDRQSFDQASRDLRDIKRVQFEQMAALRKATGIAKIPALIKHIEERLNETNKIALFCHHHDVMGPIAEYFKGICVQHNGRMTPTQKQQSVDRFQTDPRCNLFDAGITTAEGYTITECSYGIIGEEDWRPTVVTQAEDRMHRMGQVNPVLVQHVVFDGSLDARMVKRTIEKQEIIDGAIG